MLCISSHTAGSPCVTARGSILGSEFQCGNTLTVFWKHTYCEGFQVLCDFVGITCIRQ